MWDTLSALLSATGEGVPFGRCWRLDFQYVPAEEVEAPERLRAFCEAIDFITAMFDIHGIATSRADDEHCGGSIVPHLIVPHPTLSVTTLEGITAAAFIRNSSWDEGHAYLRLDTGDSRGSVRVWQVNAGLQYIQELGHGVQTEGEAVKSLCRAERETYEARSVALVGIDKVGVCVWGISNDRVEGDFAPVEVHDSEADVAGSGDSILPGFLREMDVPPGQGYEPIPIRLEKLDIPLTGEDGKCFMDARTLVQSTKRYPTEEEPALFVQTASKSIVPWRLTHLNAEPLGATTKWLKSAKHITAKLLPGRLSNFTAHWPLLDPDTGDYDTKYLLTAGGEIYVFHCGNGYGLLEDGDEATLEKERQARLLLHGLIPDDGIPVGIVSYFFAFPSAFVGATREVRNRLEPDTEASREFAAAPVTGLQLKYKSQLPLIDHVPAN